MLTILLTYEGGYQVTVSVCAATTELRDLAQAYAATSAEIINYQA